MAQLSTSVPWSQKKIADISHGLQCGQSPIETKTNHVSPLLAYSPKENIKHVFHSHDRQFDTFVVCHGWLLQLLCLDRIPVSSHSLQCGHFQNEAK
jgi:hypothetical protein